MDESSKPLTKHQAIEQVIALMTGPMELEEFYSRVLALSPSQAKTPKSRIRDALRFDFLGKNLLFLDKQTLIPLSLAMRGVRFRVLLSRQELNKGWLFVFPLSSFLRPRIYTLKNSCWKKPVGVQSR